MIKIVKEHSAFQYLLIEIQLYTLNGILSSRIFKQIRSKSIIQNVFRMQDNESIMCGIYFITFI